MKLVALDGHPGRSGTSSRLLRAYCEGAQDTGWDVDNIVLRDMAFDPILHEGYRERQEWEPDLEAAVSAIKACDHLVVAFPMWWGGQPALLKGFFDRALLPGVAFKYHDNDPFWDRLLSGRSADVIITADTPKFFLQLSYGSPILKQIEKQVLGFCGFKPVRVKYFAPVRTKNDKAIEKWEANAKTFGSKIVPSK
ncbi:MAG: NAD(P)H-dependent oxidoreductase [Pseudomonadota bacterium]